MFNASELTWADIKSTPIPGKQYLEKIKDPVEKQKHMFNYSEYQPKLDSINQIQKFLEKNQQIVKILGIGASWCGDCARNVAHLIKIQEKFKKNVVSVNILGGIKKKLGGGWAVPHHHLKLWIRNLI